MGFLFSLFGNRLGVVAAALLLTLSANAAVVIPTNSVWRFFRGTNEASGPTGTEWRTNTFND